MSWSVVSQVNIQQNRRININILKALCIIVCHLLIGQLISTGAMVIDLSFIY